MRSSLVLLCTLITTEEINKENRKNKHIHSITSVTTAELQRKVLNREEQGSDVVRRFDPQAPG